MWRLAKKCHKRTGSGGVRRPGRMAFSFRRGRSLGPGGALRCKAARAIHRWERLEGERKGPTGTQRNRCGGKGVVRGRW